MNELEFSNFDESDLYEDFWVMASYIDSENMTQEEQIGEVTLRKDIVQNDMPFELEINGTVYKRGGLNGENSKN